MQEITIAGEVPPKKNAQHISSNRIIKPRRVKDYEDMVATELLAQRARRINGFIALDILVVYKRNRDIGGAVETLCDALQNGGLFDDDTQIIHLTAKKRPTRDHETPFALVLAGETAPIF